MFDTVWPHSSTVLCLDGGFTLAMYEVEILIRYLSKSVLDFSLLLFVVISCTSAKEGGAGVGCPAAQSNRSP